jgi:hypothetical protein
MNPATRLMIAKLTSLAEQGKTYLEAAAEVNATYHYVASFANRYGIPLRQLQRGRHAAPPDERSEDMRSLYVAGTTLVQIGEKYGVTRERVRQILTKHYGIRAKDGGQSEQTRKLRKEFQRKRDARSLRTWGCNYREYQRILKHKGRPTYAYWAQRKNAHARGIVWEFSLWQWWKIWEQSGRWPERGNGKGYCMCRLGDTGSYAVDNVYIATGTENMQDHWVKRRALASLELAQ